MLKFQKQMLFCGYFGLLKIMEETDALRQNEDICDDSHEFYSGAESQTQVVCLALETIEKGEVELRKLLL